MDVTLSAEQRAWQFEGAPNSHRRTSRPISLERDQTSGRTRRSAGHHPQGSQLGFAPRRIQAMGWARHRFRHPGAWSSRNWRRRTADRQDFQPVLEVESSHRGILHADRRKDFSSRSWRTDTFLLGHAGTEPNARLRPRPPPKTIRARAGSSKPSAMAKEWWLNGEKCFIANGSVRSFFFVSTPHQSRRQHPRGSTGISWCRSTTPGLRMG